ncbi:MAG: GTPase Era [Ignavibacteriaceae bacterium]
MNVKSGYVSIIGKPNAGKSTLLNSFLKLKFSIATNKPQTTRKNIIGILSEEEYQIIFLDTPGILEPKYLLQKKMVEAVHSAVANADVVLALAECSARGVRKDILKENLVSEVLQQTSKKKILVLTKVDLISQEKVTEEIELLHQLKMFDEIVAVSAQEKFQIDVLIKLILHYLPEHPKYYPDDVLSSKSERFFVSEFIREKIFLFYEDEIPYSTEVVIEDFKEREGRKDFIQAEIYVEKESQRKILIGKDGAGIKKLGSAARKDIEAFLERPVFLDLRVRVKEHWRKDENMLRTLGYGDE